MSIWSANPQQPFFFLLLSSTGSEGESAAGQRHLLDFQFTDQRAIQGVEHVLVVISFHPSVLRSSKNKHRLDKFRIAQVISIKANITKNKH